MSMARKGVRERATVVDRLGGHPGRHLEKGVPIQTPTAKSLRRVKGAGDGGESDLTTPKAGGRGLDVA